MRLQSWLLPLLLTVMVLSGCAAGDSLETKLKAPPSRGAGFVPVEQMAKRGDLPFNKVWVKQGVNWKKYRTIYVARVHTDYLIRANWWQQTIRADQMKQDVASMAAYMRTQFSRAFQNDPRHRLLVAPSPERGSLTLEMALTELVPSHVLLNAVKIAGPYGSGVAAAVMERETEAQSTVAFEARIKDSDTGETLATVADREYAKARIIDLKGLTWYGNAKEVVDTWSQQFVDIANRRPGQAVKPASSFTLLPW